MADHAKLSASGSKRWLTCPPSANLEQQFAEETSAYAEEGTLAHEVAYHLLRIHLGGNDGADICEYEELRKRRNVTPEMEEHVQRYVDIVIEKINAARAICPDPVILLEQKLDFSPWVPEGFGTGDVVIIADGLCEVIDLKYGKGVPVSAENNSQTRLYGLGAVNAYDCLYDITRIKMTIVQPRLDSVSEEELPVQDLLTWGENEVKPRAALAIAGKGEFSPCEEACRFCRARHTCRARAEENLKLSVYDFQDAFLLNPTEIADILGRVDALVSWAGDVKTWALNQAEKFGVQYPGWKLVEGRSNRTIPDENAPSVASNLTAGGYTEEQIYNKKLKGIGDLEKLLGKAGYAIIEPYVIKPVGKPTLAPESDKRPAISSAESANKDFADPASAAGWQPRPDSNVFKPGMNAKEMHDAAAKVIGGR